MSTNKTIFRTEGRSHADAIHDALFLRGFPSVDRVQVLSSHPSISEFVVVVLIDCDKDGWLSDLIGVAEVVIETLPPPPHSYHWISRRLTAPVTVSVTRIGPCTASKAAEVAASYGHGKAQAFDNPQDALDWVSSKLVSKE